MDKMPMTKKSVRLLLAGLIVMAAGYVLLGSKQEIKLNK